jgi:TRAP-type mannitol/chloroaromatic compound transport system permease large subunit
MAPAIFYLRAVAPPEITIKHMYRGVIPFIALQCLTLVIVILFPTLVTYLPSVMLNFR